MELMLVDVLTAMSQWLLVGYAFAKMLKAPSAAQFVVIFSLVNMGVYLLVNYTEAIPMSFFVKALFLMAVVLALVVCLLPGKLIYKIMCVILMNVCTMFVEMFLPFMAGLFMENFESMLIRQSIEMLLLVRGIVLLMLIPLMYMLYLAWIAVFDRARLDSLNLYLLFPISQMIALVWMWSLCVVYVDTPAAHIVCMLIAIIFFLADVALFYAVHQLNEKHLLEQKSRVMESQLAAQLAYYDQLTENMAKTNQMRHDINNQLQTAYALLQTGENRQVQSQLDQLTNYLQTYSSQVFCANSIVDAVLVEKERICIQQDIDLEIDASLPPELPVEGIELCSLFANLLDNAIAACSAANVAGAATFIQFSAYVQAGTMIIKMKNSNPVSAPAQKEFQPLRKAGELQNHGLGMLIIKEITDKYQGEISAKVVEDYYETVIWLNLKVPTEEVA